MRRIFQQIIKFILMIFLPPTLCVAQTAQQFDWHCTQFKAIPFKNKTIKFVDGDYFHFIVDIPTQKYCIYNNEKQRKECNDPDKFGHYGAKVLDDKIIFGNLMSIKLEVDKTTEILRYSIGKYAMTAQCKKLPFSGIPPK